MVEKFNRHHFLNYRTAVKELLQEIEFVNEEKSIRITREIEEEIVNYRDFSYFYFSENQLLGVLFAKPKKDLNEIGKTMEIKYLSVRKKYQNKGIATELMGFLMANVKFSFANIFLRLYEKNEFAIKFYKKFRFVPFRINKQIQTLVLDSGTNYEHTDVYYIRRMPLQNVTIRPLRTSNIDFLKEMVFQSLHKGNELFDRAILEKKDLAKYYKNWDSKREIGFIARYEDRDIGAVWCRFFPYYDQGFGYVDESIPEMRIAVYEEYQNRGLGQILMEHLFSRLKHQGVKGVSISVHENNSAKKAYQSLGFITISRDEHLHTMIKKLE